MESANKKQLKNSLVETLYEASEVFLSAILIILVVFTFLFRFVGVYGNSMVPTLHDGDWLLIKTGTYEPQAKDIIIITQPNYFHEPIVKRVIATEFQEVDYDIQTGTVYVDGVALVEDYINEATSSDYFEVNVQFPLTVPKNCVFVMGDNRGHSTDSRSTKVGFIDERYILGKVSARILPRVDFKID